jgi:hypothetical protein
MSATEVRDRTSEIIILKYDSFVTADSIVASGKTDGTEYSRACSVYDVPLRYFGCGISNRAVNAESRQTPIYFPFALLNNTELSQRCIQTMSCCTNIIDELDSGEKQDSVRRDGLLVH